VPETSRISVLVAAFNEQRTIEEVLDRALDLNLDAEIIVVDDGSCDGTAAIVERVATGHPDRVRLLRHAVNRGKGAALRTALAASRGAVVVIQDADLEYEPSEIPQMIAPIVDGYADVVYGTRLRGGRPQRAHMFWHLVGNRALSLLTNVLYNTTISDMETGFKAFRGDLIRSLPLTSDDFRIEAEITAKLLRQQGLRLYEIPISYYGRTYAEGKKITWRDGYRAAGALIRYRVQ
jgi:glycosyltransferase involved in cell wall biosynthesis